MVTVRIPDDLRDRIDAARGDVPRERWVRRSLEDALKREGVSCSDSAPSERREAQ